MTDSIQIPVLLPMALMLAAGIHDVLTMRIPNPLVLLLFLLFWPAAVLAGLGGVQIAIHAAVFLAVFGLGFAAYRFGSVGGGDVKLLSVCALWSGTQTLIPSLITMAFLGGGFAVLIRLADRFAPFIIRRGIAGRMIAEQRIPYGAAIAGGFLIWFLSSPVPMQRP